MAPPILISTYFLDYILPFVLVFTLIFAILQKSKLLGDEAKQINAIIGMVIGLILIAFPYPRDIIVLLMPFLAVFAVILFVFMLLYGFISGNKSGDILGKGWKAVWAGVLVVGLIYILLLITGYWDIVYNFMFNSRQGVQVWINGLLIVVIAGAIIAVLRGDKGSSS